MVNLIVCKEKIKMNNAFFLVYLIGFPELNQDDQLILIKCGFFEVWLTRMARMFNKGDGCLTFEDGSIIPKEELGVVFSVITRERWWNIL